jgi:hypothetical protein
MLTLNLTALSDGDLIKNLENISLKEVRTTVEVVLHLAELERRNLHIELGYSSLFDYAVRGLRYAETAALRRISAARAFREFPDILPLLLSKELSLTTLSKVATLPPPANKDQVLKSVKGKSKREVEDFVAMAKPREVPIKETIKPIAVKVKPKSVALFEAPEAPKNKEQIQAAAFAAPGSGNVPDLKPMASEKRYELRFSVDEETLKNLNEAQILLSGKFPKGARIEAVFEEALSVLLERLSPKRRQERRAKGGKESAKCTEVPQSKPSRHMPQPLRDAVYERDGGCCTYTSADGVRCQSRHDLECHHKEPHALGGSADAENLTLRCRVHNILAAEKDFGREFMERFT